MSFRLAARAEEDLDEIDEYVASKFGEDVAERVIDRLFETFELLVDSPHLGRPRPNWAPDDVRFFPVPGTPSLIIYRSRDALEILRIWHGRRDPSRIDSEIEEN
jgi:plasmid stabilization system protein ParE